MIIIYHSIYSIILWCTPLSPIVDDIVNALSGRSVDDHLNPLVNSDCIIVLYMHTIVLTSRHSDISVSLLV